MADLDDFEYTLTRRALRQIKAEAWEEGHCGLCRRHGVVPFEACRNPYATEETP